MSDHQLFFYSILLCVIAILRVLDITDGLIYNLAHSSIFLFNNDMSKTSTTICIDSRHMNDLLLIIDIYFKVTLHKFAINKNRFLFYD